MAGGCCEKTEIYVSVCEAHWVVTPSPYEHSYNTRFVLCANGTLCAVGERYDALRHIIGGALAWWDNNHEELDRLHNKELIPMLVCIQNLFIERLQEWSALMAPSGWRSDKHDGDNGGT